MHSNGTHFAWAWSVSDDSLPLKSTLKLKKYTGDAIPVVGEIEFNIEYKKQIVSAARFVVGSLLQVLVNWPGFAQGDSVPLNAN